MRILVGAYFYPRGGSAYAIRATCELLSRAGHDVYLVSGSDSASRNRANAVVFYGSTLRGVHDYASALHAFAGGEDPMDHVTPVHASYERKAGVPDRDFADVEYKFFEAQVSAWLRTFAEVTFRPDVLHLHHLTPMTLAAHQTWPDIPIVTTLHGTELKWLERASSEGGDARRWRGMMREAARMSAVVVALNTEDSDIAQRVLGLSNTKIAVVGGGVDTELFRPPSEPRRSKSSAPEPIALDGSRSSLLDPRPKVDSATAPADVVFLAVSRYLDAKRIPLLLRAFKLLQDRLGDECPELIVLGGAPEEVEGEYPPHVSAGLLLEKVRFLPPVDQPAVVAALQAADVMVLPSVGESFGQVFFEALACGTPIIAAKSGAPGEILAGCLPSVGWFADPDDEVSLFDQMVEAMQDSTERKRRGAAGRELVVRSHSWAAVVARLELICGELVPGLVAPIGHLGSPRGNKG